MEVVSLEEFKRRIMTFYESKEEGVNILIALESSETSLSLKDWLHQVILRTCFEEGKEVNNEAVLDMISTTTRGFNKRLPLIVVGIEGNIMPVKKLMKQLASLESHSLRCSINSLIIKVDDLSCFTCIPPALRPDT
eukprot:TRINITY_DN6384_c0_g1_i1.p1 TRINITY_DN6384_c0_g1~~TRINITY_DN6384_c0_g1_i1.p1  ORF type:complete len:136 (+),score=18.73 TRINITY_DN6384_c0_g1_i1:106-513(+)